MLLILLVFIVIDFSMQKLKFFISKCKNKIVKDKKTPTNKFIQKRAIIKTADLEKKVKSVKSILFNI